MNKVIVTPEGICRYPHIKTPNKTFNPDGLFSCDLVVEEADAKAFAKEVEKIWDEGHAREQEKKGKAIKKADHFPIQQLEDGRWIIKTKQKAKGKSKSGEDFHFTIKVFDQSGNLIKDEVGGGTKCKVAVEPRCWFAPSFGFGITLTLKAVQVIELISPSDGGTAESFGFSTENADLGNGGESFEKALAENEENGDF